MHPIEFSVRNPVKVAVGVLLLVLFGGISLYRMSVQLTPEVKIPTINIQTFWPGASPQEVEREIVQEQEEQLQGVEGCIKMSSESMDSMATITLEFSVGTDLGEALLKVNTRLQQVPEYPEDADEPVISTSGASDRAIAWFVLGQAAVSPDEIARWQDSRPELRAILEPVRRTESEGLRMLRLRTLAREHPELSELLPPEMDVPALRKFAEDFIETRFERVPGVANSNVFGGRMEEMQVIVDPRKLAARQLTIADVRRALRGQNADVSGGDFWEGKRRYVVRTLGQFRSPEQVAGSILARAGDNTVYVRDVAEVKLGYRKPQGIVRRFGRTNIAMNVLRETGGNVLSIMGGLRNAVAELNDGLLRQRGLHLQQVYDETDYIYSAIGLVQQNIVIGGFLTITILLLFLRSIRSTLIIALAIPVSILGTFLLLSLMGRSLNVISLAGLAFAVGMLVDNAIVVLENIYRHHQAGEPIGKAVLRGSQEVWGAVLASTATTLAVFIPVLFVEEEAGQLFRDIALAVSSAVGLSLLISVIVIPAAANKLLRLPSAATRARTLAGVKDRLLRPIDLFGHGFVGAVVGLNAWLQKGLLRRLGAIAVIVATALTSAWALVPKVEYLPTGNQNLVFGIILPPPGYNIEELVEIGGRIEERLRPYWDVDPDGDAAAKLDFPPIGDWFIVAFGRQIFMGLRAIDPLRAAELVPLMQRVVSGIPGAFGVASQASLFERGLGEGRTIDVEISGPDLPALVGLGGQVMGGVMSAIPGAQAFPRPSLDLSSPELHVIPKWEEAAELGIAAADLGYTVNALVDGAYASDYFTGGDKIDLVIKGPDNLAARTQDLALFSIATPAGGYVPLAAVADVRLGSGPEQINHRERQRAVTIQVRPPETVALEDAMDRILQQVVAPLEASGALAGGHRIMLSGTVDKLRATWEALRFNFILALIITYLLMAALFESWTYPFVIIFSVPLGAVGGLIGLRVLNEFVTQQLDVLTMLGFIILVGTVVNNAILIVHQALNRMRDAGMEPNPAILMSVRTRIRPIFMTTLTSLGGMTPLVVAPGAGSELYRGLGSVLLGGLLVSTLFTLVLVPTLFSVAMQARAALQRLLGRASAAVPALADVPAADES
ncbi:MAG: efflux RND transporter permease subunit [Planctomycetota bacterium]